MKILLPLLVAAGLATALPARADDAPWVLRFGAHAVDPKSDNGSLAGMKAKVGGDLKPTASLEYLITPNWGAELLLAAPFRHNVRLDGAKVAQAHQLPPVLGVNYHFMPERTVSPFLGLGLNYTRFFDVDGKGALRGANVDLGSSWGLAAHAGVDVRIAPRWSLTVDLRWIDLASDVKVNGAKLGHVTVNPLVYGVSFAYRF